MSCMIGREGLFDDGELEEMLAELTFVGISYRVDNITEEWRVTRRYTHSRQQAWG